jgi:hypothetical protein
MKPVDAPEFAALRRKVLRHYGRIRSADARGFLIDLDQALEKSGLSKVKARWRGDPDWGFTATAEYPGTPEEAISSVLSCLIDDVAYSDVEPATPFASASIDRVGPTIQVLFVTWHPDIGAASVRVDLTRRGAVKGSGVG